MSLRSTRICVTFLGIGNDEILAVNLDIAACAKDLLSQLMDEDSELVTIYYGSDIEESTANELAEFVQEKFEQCEVEVHRGGQPLYHYILSVE